MNNRISLIIVLLLLVIGIQSCTNDTSKSKMKSKTAMPIAVKKSNDILAGFIRISKKSTTSIQMIGNKRVGKEAVELTKIGKSIVISGYAFDSVNEGLSKNIFVSLNGKIQQCETLIKNNKTLKKFGKKFENAGFKVSVPSVRLKNGVNKVRIIPSDMSGKGVYKMGKIYEFTVK